MRFYDFKADEILNSDNPNLDEELDPKMVWALNNMHYFPMEINKVSLEELIRIPGIGVKSAYKIINARRFKKLHFEDLRYLKISIKKAKYFIVCNGKYQKDIPLYRENIKLDFLKPAKPKELSLFDIDYSVVTGQL